MSGVTTKENMDRLQETMVKAYKEAMQGLVRSKSVERRVADDMAFAYGQGAKHLLEHLEKMGIVEYIKR
jgi:hypothetical protein